MFDTLVVGGGIVGASVAYHESKADRDVLLVDRDDEGKATRAGAGIISPPTNAQTSLTWNRFGIAAEQYYPELAAALEAEQDGDVGYARCGKLTVAVSEEERELFADARDRIRQQREELDYPDEDAIYELSDAEARELFPPLGPVHDALYYEGAARVDGNLFSQALTRAGETHGLTVREGTVERLVEEDGAVTGGVVDGEAVSAESVVIAGGAWSAEFGEQLGVSIDVEPLRGQILHLDVPDGGTDEWTVVNAFRNHYVVPWDDDHVAVGATHEHVGFRPQVTLGGMSEVVDEALRVAPGLETAEYREFRVGLRPATEDGMPIVGPAPNHDDVYVATGHGRYGLQLGPYTGKVVSELCRGVDTYGDIQAFAP